MWRKQKMKLITKEIENKLSGIGETDGKGLENIKPPLKLFNPSGAGTWYIWEYDGEDLMYGICELLEKELVYVSFQELKSLKLPPFGLGIERDSGWSGNKTAAEIMEGK